VLPDTLVWVGSSIEPLTAGREVVVETPFGTFRGILSQAHVDGSDVRLRCLGHDIRLHRHSVSRVRSGEGERLAGRHGGPPAILWL
jgi:hypothetical protein